MREKSFYLLFIFVNISCILSIVFAGNEPIDSTKEPIQIKEYYPKNITDMYRGYWSPANISTNLGCIGFDKLSGTLVYTLTNKKTSFAGIDSVEGELRFRDGIYSTDSTLYFYLQGFYIQHIGLAYLIANPMGQDLPIEDYVIELPRNGSLVDAVEKANRDTLLKLGNMTGTIFDVDKCFLSIFLKFEPVSPDFNDRYSWAYLPKGDREEEFEDKVRPILKMEGSIKSPTCNFTLTFESSSIPDTYHDKAINYAVVVAIGYFIQVVLLIRQMEYSNTQTGASKVSILMIAVQAMMDSYLCLLHLFAGLSVSQLFNAYACAAFFQFICFSVFEMRYLFTIWKARNSQTNLDIRTEFSRLYIRFYISLIIGFMILYNSGGLFHFFILLLYSFFIPQIVSNARRNCNKSLTPQYIIGTAAIRLIIPMYFWGCPKNFAHVEPNFLFSSYLVAWVLFQVIVLFSQDYLGPRFFVPKQFLPQQYDYNRPYRRGEAPECVICMSSLDLSSEEYMLTPCEHIFHKDCLLRWLEQKMECPTCRGALPSTNNV